MAAYDPVTLDQLRAFVTVVDAGSFSAAGRKLGRVQSAVSTAMANLESQLAITAWDRSTRIPTLTDQGRAVLGAARRVLAEVDELRSLTAAMTRGLEASVSLCVDALFPLRALVDLCRDFARAFPAVDLRVDTAVLSGVSARVESGRATLGVVSPAARMRGLEKHPLAPIRMVPVVSPSHPLAAVKGSVPSKALSRAVQIVLSESGGDGGGDDRGEGVSDQAVLSPRTWRVGDLHTKHEMLKAGLGWGNLPSHLVADDLVSKALVRIRPAAWAEDEHTLHLSAVHRGGTVLGPAHRWVIAQLALLCAREASEL